LPFHEPDDNRVDWEFADLIRAAGMPIKADDIGVETSIIGSSKEKEKTMTEQYVLFFSVLAPIPSSNGYHSNGGSDQKLTPTDHAILSSGNPYQIKKLYYYRDLYICILPFDSNITATIPEKIKIKNEQMTAEPAVAAYPGATSAGTTSDYITQKEEYLTFLTKQDSALDPMAQAGKIKSDHIIKPIVRSIVGDKLVDDPNFRYQWTVVRLAEVGMLAVELLSNGSVSSGMLQRIVEKLADGAAGGGSLP
jgi:hypothetical protein